MNRILKTSLMSQSLRITTPFPSVQETAQRAGVTPARARELLEVAQEIVGRESRVTGSPTGRKDFKGSPAKSIGRKKRK